MAEIDKQSLTFAQRRRTASWIHEWIYWINQDAKKKVMKLENIFFRKKTSISYYFIYIFFFQSIKIMKCVVCVPSI